MHTALVNPVDKFKLAVGKLVDELLVEQVVENDGLVTRLLSDRGIHEFVSSIFLEHLFDRIHADAREAAVTAQLC